MTYPRLDGFHIGWPSAGSRWSYFLKLSEALSNVGIFVGVRPVLLTPTAPQCPKSRPDAPVIGCRDIDSMIGPSRRQQGQLNSGTF
jgi:hypothetical protein